MGIPRSPEEKAALAQKRAELIIQVRSGAITATEAASQLGVSRKTYYGWEAKGLEGLMEALKDAPDGRPAAPLDPQKEALQKRVEELEDRERILEQKLVIQRVILEAEAEAEKKEARATVVERTEQLHEGIHWSYRRLTAGMDVAYASYMRWKHRIVRCEPVLERPGPKKALPLDFAVLDEDVRGLRHGPRRTAGTGGLYRRHRDRVPRRALLQRVQEVRQELNRERRAKKQKVEWLVPGAVWSMDQTQIGDQLLHQVQDLASRYKFEPLVQDGISGEDVVQEIEKLFREYGAPLVLKFDNGSVMKNEAVMDVLSRWGVIPLPSPAYYPPYNGGIERAACEIKKKLPLEPRSHRSEDAGLIVHSLNHKPRKVLQNRTACAVFGARYELTKPWTARYRKEAFDWIIQANKRRLAHMKATGHRNAPAAAWRQAVETWLLNHEVIRIKKPSECYPLPREKRSHK